MMENGDGDARCNEHDIGIDGLRFTALDRLEGNLCARFRLFNAGNLGTEIETLARQLADEIGDTLGAEA